MKLLSDQFKPGIVMECGCAATGTLRLGPNEPTYVACGLHSCTEVAEQAPDLTCRKAECSYGGNIVDSSFKLPFFRHHPDREYDEYYCGCFGWD